MVGHAPLTSLLVAMAIVADAPLHSAACRAAVQFATALETLISF
jgi:hypothetical protein